MAVFRRDYLNCRMKNMFYGLLIAEFKDFNKAIEALEEFLPFMPPECSVFVYNFFICPLFYV